MKDVIVFTDKQPFFKFRTPEIATITSIAVKASEVMQGQTEYFEVWRSLVRTSEVGQGTARSGEVWRGLAWSGEVGKARRGQARLAR